MKKILLSLELALASLLSFAQNGNNFPTPAVGGQLSPNTLSNVVYASDSRYFNGNSCAGGPDINVAITNAFASVACKSVGNQQCHVRVPNPGSSGYNACTTFSVPFQNIGTSMLEIDAGTVINVLCTNSCDWIQDFATGVANNNGFILQGNGARIVGTVQAGNGFHCRSKVMDKIYDITFTGFTDPTSLSRGNGILNEGCVGLVATGVFYIGNNLGIQNVGWSAGPGTVSGANGNAYSFGRSQANNTGGVLENGNCTVGCSFPDVNNTYHQIDIEGNGGTTVTTTGSLTSSTTSNVATITGAGTTQGCNAGTYAHITGCTQAAVNGDWLIQSAAAGSFTFNDTTANSSGTTCTAACYHYNAWVENGININFRHNFFQWAGGTSGELAEFLHGDSQWQPKGTNVRDVAFSSVGSTNTIYAYQESGFTVDGTYELSSVTNFFNCGPGVHSGLDLDMPPANSSATAFVSACAGVAGAVIGLPLHASFTTTASATDNVTVTGITAQGTCKLTPTNSSATGLAGFISSISANTVVVGHTATSGGTYTLDCTPYN